MIRTNTILSGLRARPSRFVPLLIIALSLSSLLVLPRSGSAAGYAQELERLNRLVQASGGSDAEMKIFREGRDLVGDEEWGKAASKFREYVSKYPKGKDTDARSTGWRSRSRNRRSIRKQTERWSG